MLYMKIRSHHQMESHTYLSKSYTIYTYYNHIYLYIHVIHHYKIMSLFLCLFYTPYCPSLLNITEAIAPYLYNLFSIIFEFIISFLFQVIPRIPKGVLSLSVNCIAPKYSTPDLETISDNTGSEDLKSFIAPK